MKKEEAWDKIFLVPLKRGQWVIFERTIDDARTFWSEYNQGKLFGIIDREIDPHYWWREGDYQGGKAYFVVVELFRFSYHRPLKAYRRELTPISKPSRLRLLIRSLRRRGTEFE